MFLWRSITYTFEQSVSSLLIQKRFPPLAPHSFHFIVLILTLAVSFIL